MDTREIPKGNWETFFDSLNEQYRGWNVRVEVLGRDIGDQWTGKDLPLQGINLERKGSEAGDIIVGAGESPDQFMSHHIDQPQHIWIANFQMGNQTDVEIDSADGLKTLIHLCPPIELSGGQSAQA